MKFKIKKDKDEYYRGSIPFLLTQNKSNIYISARNKNLDDYYYVLNDFYPGRVLKMEKINISKEELRGKKQELIELLKDEKPFVILASLAFATDNFPDISNFLLLENSKTYKMKDIKLYLEDNGYKNNYLIEDRGEYSHRGDILDIFPVNEKYPIRISFFDNEIDRISYFDITNQRSISKFENKKQIKIFSNKMNSGKGNIIDLISKLSSLSKVKIYIEKDDFLDYKLEEIITFYKKDETNITEKKIRNNYKKIISKGKFLKILSFTERELSQFKDYEMIGKISKDENILILTEEEKRVKEKLIDYDNIKIKKYPYYEGFRYEEKLIITDRELKGIVVRREEASTSIKIENVNQIEKGEYIIHEKFGVGIFQGIEMQRGSDYIKIKYADQDKLYVPIDHINRVEKYLTDKAKEPKIYTLGIKGFRKKKAKIREKIIEFAKKLINTAAKREVKKGHAFGKDTVWQEEFEEGFPFRETKDQKQAILDTKKDMEAPIAMDRIICGDVGYGKTEVALRAAFKAVMDGTQVTILAPTTILVNQHFRVFKDRFKNYPIEIAGISRLNKKREQKEILKGLEKGVIDIIIGTHRLIQKDIKYKKLGLLIIDEEQKFGVKAKEKMKNYRYNIDILTLTATPIPRTLNMALLGVKDISTIETAPENRKKIETNIIKEDKEDIRKIILKELTRDGQAFYLFNRVRGIKKKKEDLEKLFESEKQINNMNIDYIHGRLKAEDIKNKLNEFENGEIDILITTTIIENGIDIANANTIIIEDFDKLGLSQIYQIRGRVGRSSRKAYCYLMYKNKKQMTDLGKKKLEKVSEMNNISGYQLSLEDMKIRGAGEILGKKQHGAIKFLGYDMYLRMLKEETQRLKNNRGELKLKTEDKEEIIIKIDKKGYIPTEYIREKEKIKIYKRLILIDKIENLKKLENEIKDRFGKMPIQVKDLFSYYKIKILAQKSGIKSIKERKNGYILDFFEKSTSKNNLNMLLLNGTVKYISKEKKVLIEEKKDLGKILKKIIKKGSD
ncbi:MAG: DEAD/DEAH box helicase [Fusobacteriota bacterium]